MSQVVQSERKWFHAFENLNVHIQVPVFIQNMMHKHQSNKDNRLEDDAKGITEPFILDLDKFETMHYVNNYETSIQAEEEHQSKWLHTILNWKSFFNQAQ